MRTSTRFRRYWISDKPLADLRSTAIEDLCRVRRSSVLVDDGGESEEWESEEWESGLGLSIRRTEAP